MKTIVGIRPTGKLHLGHYFSVIKPALEEGADVLIARYHAPEEEWRTLYNDPRLFGMWVILQRLNVDLYFKLLNASRFGELSRMTQFKSQKPTPHLLIYPVLMCHDLVGYDRVIVGEDQRQHVEYANVLFKRLGLPKIEAKFTCRIMGFRDPTKKMSKSDPKGCLFLDDPPEVKEKKIMKAVTTPEGRKNLEFLYKEFVGGTPPEKNIDLKKELIKGIGKQANLI